MRRRPINRILVTAMLAAVVPPITSCTTDAFNALLAPASNFQNGLLVPRAIQVGFVNNTPFRAIFTFGAYDSLDQDSLPTNFGQLRLEAATSSAQVAQPCRQVFSVGGEELIRLIEKNEADPAINVTDPRALIRGVNFSAAPLGDPLEAEPTEGSIDGRLVANGVDFTCARTDIREITGSGLLLFTFEQDAGAPGGFRIDYSFIEP